MAVIKLKRSETSGSVPTTSDLVVGEVAINTVDKTLYARDSNDAIIKVANFGEQDLALTFPTGDYGSVLRYSLEEEPAPRTIRSPVQLGNFLLTLQTILLGSTMEVPQAVQNSC